MAPKRKQKRNPHRVNVRFNKKGDEEFAVGYTKNISPGGLFIGTNRPLPPGSEIVVEIKEGGKEMRQRPAVVVHAARVSPLLARVRTSGMGVRYLDLDEPAEVTTVPRKREEKRIREPEVAEDPSMPELQVDLSDVERFREAFRRDIQYGLIFAQSPAALETDQEVAVRVLTPGAPGGTSLRARVDRETICRIEAYGELGGAGFMLVFVEADRALSLLRTFL